MSICFFRKIFILMCVFWASNVFSMNHIWHWWFGTCIKKSMRFITFKPCTQTEKITDIHAVCNEVQLSSLESCFINAGDNAFVVSKGLPAEHKGDLIVYVPGYTGLCAKGPHRFAGSAVHQLYHWCKNNLIKTTCVCCCTPPHLRTTFNFGQWEDQKYVHECISEIAQKNPQARIILMGPCHGATTLLNYITNPNYIKNEQIKAMVLESPSISLEALIQRTALYHVPFGFCWILCPLFWFLLSGYAWDQKTFIDKNITLPANLPIFIGSLKYDDMVNDEHVRVIVEKLQKVSSDKKLIWFYETDRKDLSHGKLGIDSEYQEKVHRFLKSYSEDII